MKQDRISGPVCILSLQNGELILKSGNIRLLAAYSSSSATVFTSCRLFALETKHLRVHLPFLLILI